MIPMQIIACYNQIGFLQVENRLEFMKLAICGKYFTKILIVRSVFRILSNIKDGGLGGIS